jgi:hypothetical protein
MVAKHKKDVSTHPLHNTQLWLEAKAINEPDKN